MGGAMHLVPLFAFMAWTGTALHFCYPFQGITKIVYAVGLHVQYSFHVTFVHYVAYFVEYLVLYCYILE